MTDEDNVIKIFEENYNKTDHQLRKLANVDAKVSFMNLLRGLSKTNLTVRMISEDLSILHDLRCLLVHERGVKPVALPNAWATKRIAEILEMLTSPPRAFGIANKPVEACQDTDSLSKVIKLMFDKSYSQIPVMRGESLVSVLTTNMIARWLAQPGNNEIVDLTETIVKQALKFAAPEDKKSYKLFRLDQTVFDVLYWFSPGKGVYPIETILITANAKPTEKIMGIITAEDLPKAYKMIIPTE